jgi:chromosomal replication initiation ATPase DnaA
MAKPREITAAILAAVAKHFDITVRQIVDHDGRPSRDRTLTLARAMCAYYLRREIEGISYPEIARALKLACHTSAMRSAKRGEAWRDETAHTEVNALEVAVVGALTRLG